MSIAGGLPRALERAAESGCTALQLFTRNPRGWAARPLGDDEAAEFRALRRELGLGPVVVHANYLVNLASLDPVIRARSIESFRDEIARAVAIEADCLVVHPGSARGECATQGLSSCVDALLEAGDGMEYGPLTVCIENTAGQGTCIGRSFEEVAAIVAGCQGEMPMGMCLDTAHAFEAGYDVSTARGFADAMLLVDGTVGLERVRAVHFNDSKTELGSNADRHWHLGEGKIGYAALRRVARFRPLAHAPLILETPEDEIHSGDWNLDELRRMIA